MPRMRKCHLLIMMQRRNVQRHLLLFLSISSISIILVLQGFCATGDMQSAFAIFEQLQKGREAPDEVVCLEAFRRAKLASASPALQKRMKMWKIS